MAVLIEVLNIDDLLKLKEILIAQGLTASEVILINSGRSINYLGLGYLKVIMQEASKYGYGFICNVSDNPSFAQSAFRMGFNKVYYNGNLITYNKLFNIAKQYKVELINKLQPIKFEY